MKKIFMIWLCLSIVISAVFGVVFFSDTYLERLSNFPSFFDVFNGVVNSFRDVGMKFVNITDIVSFFTAIGSIFTAIFSLIKLPIDLIVYIINVIWCLLPFDLGITGGVSQ